MPDSHLVATRELIRPPTIRHQRAVEEPFSGGWFEELEHKRYQRQGAWLWRALEFGRHPGESLLLLGAGVGTDALQYTRTGTQVTVAITTDDYPQLIHQNLARCGVTVPVVPVDRRSLPFPDGSFDVVVWNALYDRTAANAAEVVEIFRVLRPGGKIIGLFPARYDVAFWQRWLLPVARLWWRRPPDPTTAPKTTARELRGVFSAFSDHRISKRHLRRGELPYLWRIFPLVLLERVLGRVLVMKAKKPIPSVRLLARTSSARRAAA
ncbi:MAG: methyltransferase domain-containing protein [Gemmataceae bacterium]|nr:methyltransferase domain-containing protein [Gemmataceae bacterium]